jgi:hypothetical protein
MTMHEEPPIVDLDDILDEQEEAGARVTPGQWLLVIGGGIVGVAGLLTVLVLSAPAMLDLVEVIHTLSEAGTLTP